MREEAGEASIQTDYGLEVGQIVGLIPNNHLYQPFLFVLSTDVNFRVESLNYGSQ